MDKLKIHLNSLEKWLANLENYKSELEGLYGLPLKESDLENIEILKKVINNIKKYAK